MPVNSFENYPMSWKPTLKRTKKPLYLSLAEQLEDDIHHNILRPGTNCRPNESWRIFWISMSAPLPVPLKSAPIRDF